jgi:hypothetical protein
MEIKQEELQNNAITKKSPKSRIILIVIGILFVFIVLRPTLVLDSQNFLPLSGASVQYKTSGWNGCRDNSKHITFLGFAISPAIIFPCQLTVNKSGYHVNGANRTSTVLGLLGFKIIILHKIQDPQQLIKFKRDFAPNTGMDVLSYLQDLDSKVLPENMIGEKELDFTFIPIGTIDSNSNASGKVGDLIYKMKFNGEGGIQTVSADGTKDDMGSLYYDLENLLVAPNSGYQKELEVKSGESYIARLRDGKHYMVFYLLGSAMTGYIQPSETRNLEYVGLSINDSLPGNNDPSNYDLRTRYLDLKKELSGEHTIEYGNYYRGNLDSLYLKEYLGKYYFSFTPNNNRYTDIHKPVSLSSLSNTKVVIELPPFDIFSSTFVTNGTKIPVDLFLEGKYLDPATIELK